MIGFIFVIQAIACILLMIVILMQSGRGGGLTEAFASAETMFGSKTNEVMVRATVVLASIFLVANLFLVHLSARRDSSLFNQAVRQKGKATQGLPAATLPLVTTNSTAK